MEQAGIEPGDSEYLVAQTFVVHADRIEDAMYTLGAGNGTLLNVYRAEENGPGEGAYLYTMHGDGGVVLDCGGPCDSLSEVEDSVGLGNGVYHEPWTILGDKDVHVSECKPVVYRGEPFNEHIYERHGYGTSDSWVWRLELERFDYTSYSVVLSHYAEDGDGNEELTDDRRLSNFSTGAELGAFITDVFHDHDDPLTEEEWQELVRAIDEHDEYLAEEVKEWVRSELGPE